MKTAIQQVLEYIENEMYKVANDSEKDRVTKIQQQFYAGSYSTFAKILLELEVNFLEIEKKQIIEAYREGKLTGYENSENYYNERFEDNSNGYVKTTNRYPLG